MKYIYRYHDLIAQLDELLPNLKTSDQVLITTYYNLYANALLTSVIREYDIIVNNNALFNQQTQIIINKYNIDDYITNLIETPSKDLIPTTSKYFLSQTLKRLNNL